ncbi:MAG TPA: GNAT family N-acetyltransferase [Candidatus Binatus sp.]|nr:GNAT family N-acetyltransferase [Candidatus Binatus sp.]
MKRFILKELGPETWTDFAKLASKQGQCWCMFYQRPRPLHKGKVPADQRGRVNRLDKQRLVRKGLAHAVLVYDEDNAIGWCQYGPKQELPRIDAGRFYRKLEPVREQENLWRITCFFVDKDYRGTGVAKLALRGALDSIREQGGGIVEAYPVVSRKMIAVPEWRWFGTRSMFEKVGFKPVTQLGTSMLLMRRRILADS